MAYRRSTTSSLSNSNVKEERKKSSTLSNREKDGDPRRRRFICFGKAETTEERCLRECQYYQGKFNDVPALSSTDFLRQNKSNICLVDCRSDPERSISILAGALSLAEFQNAAESLPPDTRVITYCTIGYRSGLEARKLRELYGLEGRIYNLDGIVSYSHAISKVPDDSSWSIPKLIDPSTGEECREIHTFGFLWNCVQRDYRATYFSPLMLCIQSLQVGVASLICTAQRIWRNAMQCIRS